MRLLIYFFLLFTITWANAQTTLYKEWALQLQTGNIFIHTSAVNNVKGAKPVTAVFEYSWLHTSQKMYNLSSAYIRRGIALAITDYGTGILGQSIIPAWFLEPNYRITNKIQFKIRGMLGVSFLNHPFDPVKNPFNRNYSQPITPYLSIGTGLQFQVSQHVLLHLGTQFHHLSNGNYTQPNKGINWTNTSIGMVYSKDKYDFAKHKREKEKAWKQNTLIKEIGLFYVGGQDYNPAFLAKRSYAIGGLFQLTKQVGRTSGLSIGAELYNQQFTLNDNTTKTLKNGFVAGLYGGHDFLLGKVILSQHFGFNLFNQSDYFKNWYSRFAFKYYFRPKMAIGASLKAFSDNADFVDLRVLFRL